MQDPDRRLRRLVMVALLGGLVAVSVLYLPEDLRFLQGARPVTGEVVRLSEAREGPLSYRVARVRFRIGDSVMDYPVELTPLQRPRRGERLELLYNPEQPPYLRPAGRLARYQSLSAFALIVAMAGLFVALRLGARAIAGRLRRGH